MPMYDGIQSPRNDFGSTSSQLPADARFMPPITQPSEFYRYYACPSKPKYATDVKSDPCTNFSGVKLHQTNHVYKVNLPPFFTPNLPQTTPSKPRRKHHNQNRFKHFCVKITKFFKFVKQRIYAFALLNSFICFLSSLIITKEPSSSSSSISSLCRFKSGLHISYLKKDKPISIFLSASFSLWLLFCDVLEFGVNICDLLKRYCSQLLPTNQHLTHGFICSQSLALCEVSKVKSYICTANNRDCARVPSTSGIGNQVEQCSHCPVLSNLGLNVFAAKKDLHAGIIAGESPKQSSSLGEISGLSLDTCTTKKHPSTGISVRDSKHHRRRSWGIYSDQSLRRWIVLLWITIMVATSSVSAQGLAGQCYSLIKAIFLNISLSMAWAFFLNFLDSFYY